MNVSVRCPATTLLVEGVFLVTCRAGERSPSRSVANLDLQTRHCHKKSSHVRPFVLEYWFEPTALAITVQPAVIKIGLLPDLFRRNTATCLHPSDRPVGQQKLTLANGSRSELKNALRPVSRQSPGPHRRRGIPQESKLLARVLCSPDYMVGVWVDPVKGRQAASKLSRLQAAA